MARSGHNVLKKSVSIDPKVVEALSVARRRNLSAAVNEGLRVLAALDAQQHLVDQWEAEHGPFSEEELAPHLEVVLRAQIEHTKRVLHEAAEAHRTVTG